MDLRKLIREIVEAVETEHSAERELERLYIDEFKVGFETQKGQYQVVGNYTISPETKQHVKNNMEKIKSINFPKKERYGVLLLKAKIDPNQIHFISEQHKQSIKGQKLIFVGIGETSTREGTNGDLLYAVIQNDFINTLFWKKSYLSKENIKHQLSVSRVFDFPDDIIFQSQQKQTAEPTKIENIIIVDGVRWVIDPEKKNIHKKNKPDTLMTIEQAFEVFPESAQEELLKYL